MVFWTQSIEPRNCSVNYSKSARRDSAVRGRVTIDFRRLGKNNSLRCVSGNGAAKGKAEEGGELPAFRM